MYAVLVCLATALAGVQAGRCEEYKEGPCVRPGELIYLEDGQTSDYLESEWAGKVYVLDQWGGGACLGSFRALMCAEVYLRCEERMVGPEVVAVPSLPCYSVCDETVRHCSSYLGMLGQTTLYVARRGGEREGAREGRKTSPYLFLGQEGERFGVLQLIPAFSSSLLFQKKLQRAQSQL